MSDTQATVDEVVTTLSQKLDNAEIEESDLAEGVRAVVPDNDVGKVIRVYYMLLSLPLPLTLFQPLESHPKTCMLLLFLRAVLQVNSRLFQPCFLTSYIIQRLSST